MSAPDKRGTRRRGRTLMLMALALCGLTFGARPSVVVRAQTKPNIVFILTDDLDVGSLTTMLAAGLMPNLQQYVVGPGLTFSNSFISNGHGCPSRGTFYNGLYYHNWHAIDDNCSVASFTDTNTLAVWLHNAGYQTALIGRYLDGYGYTDINHDGVVNMQDVRYVPPGWDNWQAFVFPYYDSDYPPSTFPYPYENANMYKYRINDNGTVVSYGKSAQDYQVDVIAQRAANYIIGARGAAAPLFMLVAPTAPHVEVDQELGAPSSPLASQQDSPALSYHAFWKADIRPAPRYVGSVTFSVPRPPSFNEADVSDKPLWVQEKPLLDSTDITNLTRQYQDRLASLRAVDDLVGTVAQALAATGRLQNTTFLFSSDNGWFYAQHRLSGKLAAYEEAARVPLYISGPGISGPLTTTAQVTNVDWAPSIAQLAGTTPGAPVDGVSFVPLLTQPDQPWRNRYLLDNVASNVSIFSVPTYDAVRAAPSAAETPNETYVRYADGEGEFYDDTADPYQLSNLWLDSSSIRVQQRKILNQQLAELKSCGGGSCQTLEFSP